VIAVGHLWASLRRYPALLLLIAVYAASCLVVAANVYRGAGGVQQTKVLRLAHWQLEPGIRDALDDLIADYHKLHPDVEVHQILIPEEGYFQWVNTQLVGRTAPDMIECGLGGAVAWALWPKFYARYFLPLDRFVDEPNPYNKGTPLENMSWRKTYFDEMEGGYEESLQSYYRTPLSTFTVRLYYNKELIEKVWGPGFPQTYEEFITLCKKLVQYGKDNKRVLVPIAGSGYNFRQFFDAYRTAFTADYLDRLDVDYNGEVSRIESASPIYSGRVKLTEPPIRANFELVRELSEYFPQGYTSLDRDQAVFLFLQGNAAMISTGSWDYQSLGVQSEFPLAVTEIPLPAKSNPRYGRYVAGPETEAGLQGGFAIAITKTSRHADTALDFLQYASSLRQNEQLNKAMFWLPVIKGAEPREELKPFAPRIEGYSASIEYEGPGAELAYAQMSVEYLSGKVGYDEFVAGFMQAFHRELPAGVTETIRNNDQTLNQQMRFGAIRRAALAGASGAAAAMSGESAAQYKRIMEAYVTQLGGRDSDIRDWMENARLAPEGAR
jgi:raffinose/stachyose/melibiose transport system substrate-binding protein